MISNLSGVLLPYLLEAIFAFKDLRNYIINVSLHIKMYVALSCNICMETSSSDVAVLVESAGFFSCFF